MAFVTVGFEGSYTFLDNGGNLSVKVIELVGADIDEARANAVVLLGKLIAISDCAVTGYRVSEILAEDAVTPPTALNAINSLQADISVVLADDPTKHGSITVPGPKETIWVATSGPNHDIVDVADTLVVALIAAYQTGGQALLSDGEEVATPSQARGVRRTVRRRMA